MARNLSISSWLGTVEARDRPGTFRPATPSPGRESGEIGALQARPQVGDGRRGVGLVAERIELHPDDARALYMGANGLGALGEREKGLEWARRARDIGAG